MGKEFSRRSIFDRDPIFASKQQPIKLEKLFLYSNHRQSRWNADKHYYRAIYFVLQFISIHNEDSCRMYELSTIYRAFHLNVHQPDTLR